MHMGDEVEVATLKVSALDDLSAEAERRGHRGLDIPTLAALIKKDFADALDLGASKLF